MGGTERGAPAPSVEAPEEALRRRVAELEERLQEAQAAMARYRELFEFAPDGYLVTDLAGTVREANHAATVLFGRRRDFLVGTPLPFLVVPEQRADFYARLAGLGRDEDWVRGWEARLQPPRGSPRDLALTVTMVGNADGTRELRWLIRDVTEQKQAEEDLRAARDFSESLVNTAQAAVLVVGLGGEVLRVNPYLEQLSGYRQAELIGRDWLTLLPEGEQAAARAEFLSILEGRPAGRAVRPLRTRDGRQRAVVWGGRCLTADRRSVWAVLLVGQDITELQEAQRQALQMERLAAIGEMAAGLAHESRNALQRSQACLDRLGWAVQGDAHASDLVARARQAQQDLLRLYEGVREYAVPLKLDLRRRRVAEVWREAWVQVLAVGPPRDARLEEEITAEDPSCPVDAFRLAQVFRNVFDNALAACPDPVRVHVGCGDAALAGRPALAVAVRDNGPGLDDEQRRRLFEPFYTTKTKGTGLGMAIAKRIVEAHGGRIAAGPAPPPGAEIVITLPRSPV